jgi:single-strand DNA-binding protein
MSLASNRYKKPESAFEQQVSFFNAESWAHLAETCYNRGKKGRGVRVVGRLKQDRWTGTDGKPQSKITIVAEHVEFRPEFKKDAKPAEAAAESPPALYSGELTDEEYEEGAMAMANKELEAVAF